jgi:tryptophan synthase beta subunit
MRASTIEALKLAVEEGAAMSQNEFVEEAIMARLRELRRARVYAAYDEAAADPEFMRDLRETMRDFDTALPDGFDQKRA